MTVWGKYMEYLLDSIPTRTSLVLTAAVTQRRVRVSRELAWKEASDKDTDIQKERKAEIQIDRGKQRQRNRQTY